MRYLIVLLLSVGFPLTANAVITLSANGDPEGRLPFLSTRMCCLLSRQIIVPIQVAIIQPGVIPG